MLKELMAIWNKRSVSIIHVPAPIVERMNTATLPRPRRQIVSNTRSPWMQRQLPLTLGQNTKRIEVFARTHKQQTSFVDTCFVTRLDSFRLDDDSICCWSSLPSCQFHAETATCTEAPSATSVERRRWVGKASYWTTYSLTGQEIKNRQLLGRIRNYEVNTQRRFRPLPKPVLHGAHHDLSLVVMSNRPFFCGSEGEGGDVKLFTKYVL
mmetsp:Transcript_12828/g.18946  ORF Transcript_12828/g.18946 Transcript_12828/m.18946 type:complete len:209 (-) Transcript_12828:4-630(-)